MAGAIRSWTSSFQSSDRMGSLLFQGPGLSPALWPLQGMRRQTHSKDGGGACLGMLSASMATTCLSVGSRQRRSVQPALTTPPSGLRQSLSRPWGRAYTHLCVLLISQLLSCIPWCQAAQALWNLCGSPTFGFSAGDRGSTGVR